MNGHAAHALAALPERFAQRREQRAGLGLHVPLVCFQVHAARCRQGAGKAGSGQLERDQVAPVSGGPVQPFYLHELGPRHRQRGIGQPDIAHHRAAAEVVAPAQLPARHAAHLLVVPVVVDDPGVGGKVGAALELPVHRAVPEQRVQRPVGGGPADLEGVLTLCFQTLGRPAATGYFEAGTINAQSGVLDIDVARKQGKSAPAALPLSAQQGLEPQFHVGVVQAQVEAGAFINQVYAAQAQHHASGPDIHAGAADLQAAHSGRPERAAHALRRDRVTAAQPRQQRLSKQRWTENHQQREQRQDGQQQPPAPAAADGRGRLWIQLGGDAHRKPDGITSWTLLDTNTLTRAV